MTTTMLKSSLTSVGQMAVLVGVSWSELHTWVNPSLHGSSLAVFVSTNNKYRELQLSICLVNLSTILIVKESNVRRYLVALGTAQSQGIDSINEVLFHYSGLQTGALRLGDLHVL